MARQIIPRTEKGKLEYIPDGIEEFAEQIANELLNKYPTVDAMDLQMVFTKQFNFQYARAFAIETAETL